MNHFGKEMVLRERKNVPDGRAFGDVDVLKEEAGSALMELRGQKNVNAMELECEKGNRKEKRMAVYYVDKDSGDEVFQDVESGEKYGRDEFQIKYGVMARKRAYNPWGGKFGKSVPIQKFDEKMVGFIERMEGLKKQGKRCIVLKWRVDGGMSLPRWSISEKRFRSIM